jgi:hypothetical protein
MFAAIFAGVAALIYALAFFGVSVEDWELVVLGHVFVALAVFAMNVPAIRVRR